MASINLQGDTSGSISISAPSVAGSNTLTLPATTQTLATQNALGVRNRIINGDMRIDQRNAGASINATDGSFSVDRWQSYAATSNKFTMQQNAGSVTPPAEFNYYVGCTSSAATSLGSTDSYCFAQKIEGYNFADIGFGTANAKTVTLSFWVRSSLTGTFGGALSNSSLNRSYPFSYTISSANTWEQKTVTVAGDTTGTWLTTNGTGCRVIFSLGAGSSRSGTAGAWNSNNNFSSTGATSVVGTSGATWYVTGVQLEVGDTATPFEHRPYDMELARCQRYFFSLSDPAATNCGLASGYTISTTAFRALAVFPVTMRSTPTLTAVNANTFQVATSGATSVSAITGSVGTPYTFQVDATTSGQTANLPGVLRTNALATNFLQFSAEL